MIKNDSNDDKMWIAFSNKFITFNRVSYKEKIK